MDAVAYLVAATLLQASASLLQKHRVSLRRPDVGIAEAARGPGRFLGALVRDPWWLVSYLLIIPGAFCGLQALSMMDLTVVKSLGRLEIVFVVVGGSWLLGERLSRREGSGIALTVLGGVVVASEMSGAAGVAASRGAHLLYLVLCVGTGVALLAASRVAPGQLSPEAALGLAAGLVLGAGDVFVKSATEIVQARTSTFHVASLESHAILWATPELWLCLACMLSGLFLYQVGYSTGRAAVLIPVAAITATLPPMLFGVLARAEPLDVNRLQGIALLVVGGVLLSWPRRGAGGSLPPESVQPA